jgi:hypothetical protein
MDMTSLPAPRQSLAETIGRGLPITPYDFGAVGYQAPNSYDAAAFRPTAGIPDDTAALEAWAEAVSAPESAGLTFDATGFFGTSRGIKIRPPFPNAAPRSLGGDLSLISLAPMRTLLTLENVDCWSWNGSIQLVCGGSHVTWANRDVQIGLAFEGKHTRFTITGSVSCYGFQYAGVKIITYDIPDGDVSDDRLELGEWLSISGGLFGWDVGSAPVPDMAGMALTGAYSNRINSGDVGSLDQRTTMTVTPLPPAYIEEYGRVGEYPGGKRPADQVVAVKIGARPYRVTKINPNGTIEVYPWVETAAAASGTLEYIFGGLFMEGGHDGSLANIPQLASTHCVGWNCMSTYPSNIGWLTSQFDGCAMLFGAPSSPQLGGRLGGFYSEKEQGGSTYEMVMFNGDGNHLSIGNIAMADLSKWRTPFAWDGVNDIAEPGLMFCSLENRQWEKNPNGKAIYPNAYEAEVIAIQANRPTAVFDPVDRLWLRLAPFDAGQDRMFGVRSRRVIISGSGSNGQPTGIITVEPEPRPNSNTTVNGAPSIAYSGLKTPLHLVITADPATGNFTCKRLGTVPAPAMPDLGSAPTQADFNSLLEKLRANGTLAP